MKRKISVLVVIMMLGIVSVTACADDTSETKVETNQNEPEEQTENAAEQVNKATGVLEEVKDFMFVVKGDSMYYGFTYDEKPEGLSDVQIGDRVIVTYTGTINEVDPFMGEVLLVEKE